MIKQKATWYKIEYCKALNLDLKWNTTQEAKAFVLEKLKTCEVVKDGQFRTLYNENGENIFLLDS